MSVGAKRATGKPSHKSREEKCEATGQTKSLLIARIIARLLKESLALLLALLAHNSITLLLRALDRASKWSRAIEPNICRS